MPQSTPTANKKRRAKNNLNNFDISQIEADLMAVEAETLDLDNSPEKKKVGISTKESNTASSINSSTPKSVSYDPRPVNVVDFSPDSSKLLHKVLREDKKPKSTSSASSNVVAPKKPPKNLKFNSFKPSNKLSLGGMDGFKKNSSFSTSFSVEPSANQSNGAETEPAKTLVNESIVNPSVSTSNVALAGLNRANQFNRYMLEQHKTSLQNQIEKKSLFERSLDGDIEIFDKGLQTNNGKKVYNVKRRKSMLGGVDQYDLGPGRVKKALSYRPMRFILPVIALFIVGTYVMYLNIPSINIKVAENKSGVAVSEPSYTPEGYKLSNSIEVETGKVELSFKKSDGDAYNVSQKVSDWDSKALLENKILKETKEYSAFTDRGLTIYVYDDKATWVNQGKVYEIQLDGSNIDTEEMVRIAGSM
ncbi:MAG: DUF4367 domain-containing protein [Candidatus Nomurabacteria bacterium]|nr:MAG: DUF4367 domain-containing protein [Candidatus Nomurabacteria bacterium]HRV75830.1 DUF4367 domain-containing protein [Candidatus Saccharimonadales bacterium]